MLAWLVDFLTDRKIQVILENVYSDIVDINKGVPQGSILSPILFIILLTNLPNITPILSKELADDIAFSITADTHQEALILMQDAIERFSDWCKTNKLTINPQKTKVMCFSNSINQKIELKLDGILIDPVKKFKYLGMTLDAPNLTWKDHIINLVSETENTLNMMKALTGTTWGADRKSLIKIYEAQIRNKITYGCPAFISLSDTYLKRLESIQNSALRVALGTWRSTRVANMQTETNVEPLKLHIQQQSITQYYKIKAMGPNNNVHAQIFNDNEIENQNYSRFFKKPFILKTQSIIQNWNLPKTPPSKVSNTQSSPPGMTSQHTLN